MKNTLFICFFVFKAVQEQQKMIEDLKTQNQNLQKQIDELKALIKK